MRAYQNAAMMLLRQVGRIVLQNIDRVDRIKIIKNDVGHKHNTLVNNIDRDIIERLSELYSDHHILSRVSGMHKSEIADSEDQYTWVIDPLDGIDNLMAGIPLCAISIALFHNKKCVIGLIYQPIIDEIYSAIEGSGAFMDGKILRSRRQHPENETILSVSGNIDADIMMSEIQEITKRPLPMHQIRNIGCTSLSLAYQASGAFDFFYGRNIHFCSAAAGILIASEAKASIKQEKASDLTIAKLISSNASNRR